MNIQSLSVCVPAKRCINDCKFCCSKMHGGDYEDCYSNQATMTEYLEDLRKRMQYARDNGCNTLMLTGNNEPQQNRSFLCALDIINKSLRKPFYNIEIQTSGATIDDNMLDFLKSIGVTTVAISVACIDTDKINQSIIQTPDKELNLRRLCSCVKSRNMNLRICLNMNDMMCSKLDKIDYSEEFFSPSIEEAVEEVIIWCKEFKADQITCRALWTSEDGTPQAEWIKENVTKKTFDFIKTFKEIVKRDGRYLDTLEYGADRYDYKDFSVVVDEDSMAQEGKKDSVKYLIVRPNGHLYSRWDSKASLVF